MPPQNLNEYNNSLNGTVYSETSGHTKKKYKWEIVWGNVITILIIHIMGFYGLYQWLFKCKWPTFIFSHIYATIAALGVTAGTHRLWSHKSYKANLPLKILLAASHSAAFQNSVYEWARDHRVHHKYVDTDADPHNATRGLFYSHIGWLMLKKSKEVIEKGKTVFLDDLLNDPVVKYQNRYKLHIFLILAVVVPTIVPWYFWNENGWISFSVCFFRYCLVINLIMTINSLAHKYGTKPYEKTILATDGQPCGPLVLGEGWHNFHHVFPWDYRAAEFGSNGMSTNFINWMSKIGWATELKTASDDIIKKRMLRTGDGTVTPALKKGEEAQKKVEEVGDESTSGEFLWGWGDTDMDGRDKEDVIKYNKLM